MAEGGDQQCKPDLGDLLSGRCEQSDETPASREEALAEVEAFLDKISYVAVGNEDNKGNVGGAEGGPQELTDLLGGLGLSQTGGGASSGPAQDWQYRLPNNAPPCCDFVPKVGRDIEEQEKEHSLKKKQRLEELQRQQQLGFGDDVDSDPGTADEEFHKKGSEESPGLGGAQMGCPTLSELIFGVEASQAGAGEEYTPEKLRELLEQLLPKDGAVTEEAGKQMPQDDRPLLMDPGHSLGPDKLKTIHEMMGLYDDEGRRRKGLFDT